MAANARLCGKNLFTNVASERPILVVRRQMRFQIFQLCEFLEASLAPELRGAGVCKNMIAEGSESLESLLTDEAFVEFLGPEQLLLG